MSKKEFVELRVPVFYNKRTGQRSITLPKKKTNKIFRDNHDAKEVKISLWKIPMEDG